VLVPTFGRREKLVRLLLERGADRERAGADWARPLEWARRKGHDRIARLLALALFFVWCGQSGLM
jgi:hypothetical protein